MLSRKLFATFALFVIVFALFTLDFTYISDAENISQLDSQINGQTEYLEAGSVSAETTDAVNDLLIPEKESPKPEESLSPSPTPSPTPKPTVVPKKTSTPRPTPTPTPRPTVTPPPLTGTCPLSTENCVPCQAGEQYCRTEPGETAGYLGWACQNNNPANIRNGSANPATDFKNTMILNNGGVASCGVRYDSRGGSYMIFPSYAAGMSSVKAYIKGVNNGEHYAYVNTTASNCPGTGTFTCGNCTLQQFFCKFAGSSTYATSIANKMGGTVTTDTLLSWVVTNRLDNMVNTIKQTEGFFTE